MWYVVDTRGIRKRLISLLVCVIAVALAALCVRVYYPIRYIDQIQVSAAQNGLSASLVCAVIHAESKFSKTARSHKGASGLMQITKPTADWLAPQMGLAGYSYDRIFEPEINIQIGCFYLAWLMNHYQQDPELTAAAYNAGSGNVDKWLKDTSVSLDGRRLKYIPFPETKEYVKRVRWNKKIYNLILSMR